MLVKKANEKIENEQKRKEEEEQKRIDAIPEKEMYELYTLSDETGVSVSKFTDSGMRLDVVVTDPETNILSDDSKYKYNNCYIDVQGYRLDQLGQFGRDVMNTVGGTKEDTRVNLNEVSLRATEKKEEEAQQ